MSGILDNEDSVTFPNVLNERSCISPVMLFLAVCSCPFIESACPRIFWVFFTVSGKLDFSGGSTGSNFLLAAVAPGEGEVRDVVQFFVPQITDHARILIVGVRRNVEYGAQYIELFNGHLQVGRGWLSWFLGHEKERKKQEQE